jgi:hypothetical protein
MIIEELVLCSVNITLILVVCGHTIPYWACEIFNDELRELYGQAMMSEELVLCSVNFNVILVVCGHTILHWAV